MSNPPRLRLKPARLRSRQHGFAIVLMLLVMVSVGAYFLLRSLNQAARSQAPSELTTHQALQTAREALIGYAVRYPEDHAGTADAGPGYLPCPDTRFDHDDPNEKVGQAESPCAASSMTETGRFPWHTLDVAETRDGVGAPLWYAVSDNFRNNPKVKMNSETTGTLGLDTCADGGDDIVAVIIAPGPALKDQNRDEFGSNYTADIDQYLEGHNASAGDSCFTNIHDADHNDVVLPLTRRELMQAVEHRVLKDVANALSRYYADPDGDDVGDADLDCVASPQCDDGYPWLNLFTNPATSAYAGTLGTRRGLLPLRRIDADFMAPFVARWSIPTGGVITPTGDNPPTEACVRGSNEPTCTLSSAVPPAELADDVVASGASPWSIGRCRAVPDVEKTATPENELRCTATRIFTDDTGREFRREYQIALTNMPHRISPATPSSIRLESFNLTATSIGDESRASITISDFQDCADATNANCTNLGSSTLVLDKGDSLNSLQLFNVPFDLEIDGDGEIDPASIRSPGELSRWFTENEWERLLYATYAAVHGPGEEDTDCAVHAGGCLSVHWTRESGGVTTQDGVAAVLLLAGKSLSPVVAQPRPGSALANYFEADNAGGNNVFAKRPAATDFNDTIMVLEPDE